MHPVFDRILLTKKVKVFVPKHEDEVDAQVVYSKLVTNHIQSVKASSDSSNLLSYVT